jgi:hypothetical protein
MSEQSLALLEDLALVGLQAPAINEQCEVVRAITEDDLPVVLQELREHNWARANAPGSTEVRVLRSGHHKLAQLIASGIKPIDASYITGRSVNSIYSLQQDPAFNELCAHYRSMEEVKEADVLDRVTRIGFLASEILQERLEESPEKFSNSELRQLLELVAAKDGAARSTRDAPSLAVSINFVKPSAEGHDPGASKTIEGTLTEEERK